MLLELIRALRCFATGLSAGATLKKALPGASVRILEARDRIGGRILSAKVPQDVRDHGSGNNGYGGKQPYTPDLLPVGSSCSVDLGAAYVHGCNHTNSVWRLAATTGQPLDTRNGGYSIGWGEDCLWRSRDGRTLPKKTVKRAFEVSPSIHICCPPDFQKLGSMARRHLQR